MARTKTRPSRIPSAPAGVHVGDGLGVFQVGVHARFRIDEPGIDHARGALGIARVVQIKSGGAERKDRVAHGIESRPVGGEAVGVRLTVAAEVRAAGVGGVGPPVGGFAVVVVEIEIHAFRPFGSDGPRAFPHAPVGVGAQAPDGILVHASLRTMALWIGSASSSETSVIGTSAARAHEAARMR